MIFAEGSKSSWVMYAFGVTVMTTFIGLFPLLWASSAGADTMQVGLYPIGKSGFEMEGGFLMIRYENHQLIPFDLLRCRSQIPPIGKPSAEI